jgi:hypothetical protein
MPSGTKYATDVQLVTSGAVPGLNNMGTAENPDWQRDGQIEVDLVRKDGRLYMGPVDGCYADVSESRELFERCYFVARKRGLFTVDGRKIGLISD